MVESPSYDRMALATIASCSEETLREYERLDLLRARQGDGGDEFSGEMLSRLLLLERLRRLGVSMDELGQAMALTNSERGGTAAVHLETNVRPLLADLAGRVAEAARSETDPAEVDALLAAQLQLAQACESFSACAGCSHSRAECRVCGIVGQVDPTAAALLVDD